MQISAPCPEMGAPKLEKNVGLGTHSVCVIFSCFLACALAVGSTVGVQNFGRGRYSLSEILGKNDARTDNGQNTAASVGYTRAGVICNSCQLPPTVSWPNGGWPMQQQQQQLVVVGHSVRQAGTVCTL